MLINNNDLLKKWLSDEMTDEERSTFEAHEDASFYKSIIEDATQFKAANFSKMPDFEDFKKQLKEDTTPVKKLNWYKPLMRIASVALVLVGVYFMFTNNQLVEVQTAVVEKTTIALPDASKVVLNALSEVKYNEEEWQNKREIELEGEAFFDVAKGAKFDVVTASGTVSVLGTEFNIKQRGHIFEVTCYEGTVRVKTDRDTKILKVGDKYRSEAGEIVTGKHSSEMPEWINNLSTFDHTPLAEVFEELERQYGVKITTESVNTEQLFTGAFTHGNLANALNAVSEPLGINYEIINSNNVRLSMSE